MGYLTFSFHIGDSS